MGHTEPNASDMFRLIIRKMVGRYCFANHQEIAEIIAMLIRQYFQAGSHSKTSHHMRVLCCAMLTFEVVESD
jgi:hypothetical protein